MVQGKTNRFVDTQQTKNAKIRNSVFSKTEHSFQMFQTTFYLY